jgi:hypothetical protein
VCGISNYGQPFKYLGTIAANDDEFHRECNSGNVSYHSAQNTFPVSTKNPTVQSMWFCKYVKFGLAPSGDHTLSILENRLLRKIFGL